MKLTEQVKQDIDAMSIWQLRGRFRFYPYGEYQGEAGRYLQDRLIRMEMERSDENKNTPKRCGVAGGKYG